MTLTDINCHSFADDIQAYTAVEVNKVAAVRQHLNASITDICTFCASHQLQLNAFKSEVIWFRSHSNIKNIANRDLAVTIGSDCTEPVAVVCNLGVHLDCELNVRSA
jgi:hypothetical protein